MNLPKTMVNAAVAAAVAALLPLMSSAANAQIPASSPTTPPASPAAPRTVACTAAENRQFDFWIGDWDVTSADGKLAGTNLIRPILGTCVLLETWKGRADFMGMSFNSYDAPRRLWHQTWVDAAGNTLLLDGRFENSRMTLSDRDTPGKPDRGVINEITWTPNADGSVRQLWRTSADGGKTWQTAFDGHYVKSSRPQPSR